MCLLLLSEPGFRLRSRAGLFLVAIRFFPAQVSHEFDDRVGEFHRPSAVLTFLRGMTSFDSFAQQGDALF